MSAADAPRGVDAVVERLARARANRSTRRSFLGRAGRAAVLVAAGPTLATLLDADAAEARVCGQSGVSPKCATFDCNATWGWCWYASGCCAEGLLKKICDCCARNTPNPRGYCPTGTRVLCVVESCGADPRLQRKTIRRTDNADPVLFARDVARATYTDRVPIAVLGDAESAGMAACAASLSRVVSGPVLLSRRNVLAVEALGELDRLGVEFVKVVGSALPASFDAELSERGIAVERVGAAGDLAEFSGQVAEYSRSLTGSRRALVIEPGAGPGVLAGAGAVANLHRLPLLLDATATERTGLTTPRGVRTTWVVTGDGASAERYSGAVPLVAPNDGFRASALATLSLELGGVPDQVLLADETDVVSTPALGLAGRPVLLHYGTELYNGTRDYLFAHRRSVVSVEHPGDIRSSMRYELQSILNEYEAHLLRGVAGEGLPVIPQPLSERPIGNARDTRPR